MSVYPKRILERIRNPVSAGKCPAANAVGTAANFDCGSFIRFTLRINDLDQSIDEARFASNGCGFLAAAGDVWAEQLKGKLLTDLHGLRSDEYLESTITELEEIPTNRYSCLNTCFEAVRNSFSDYRAYRLEEFQGEKALICTCFGVSEETIEKCITEKSLQTVEEVTDQCKAGGGCGSCQPLILEMLDSREAF